MSNSIVPLLSFVLCILLMIRDHNLNKRSRRIEIDVSNLVKPVDLRKIDEDSEKARAELLKH